MQFKGPQFLDIEDKIFGPFSFREFAYLAGAAGMCFVLYKWLGLVFALIPMLLMAGFALLLTFYRPNNKPLIFMLEAGFKYFTQDKLYIWEKGKKSIKNECILITGSGGYLGRQLACEFAKHNATTLILWDINELENKKTLDALRAIGGGAHKRAYPYKVDLSNEIS